MTARVVPLYTHPHRGLAEFDVYPMPGAAAHRIAYHHAIGWWCTTCDPQGHGAGRRCPWIHTARNHPDTPDMEGI
jgi:hypothetical protein